MEIEFIYVLISMEINTYKEMVLGILGVISRNWQMDKVLRAILESSLILLIKIVHFQHV